MEYKTCSKCNENLSINNFNKDNRKKDGLRCDCRKCYKKTYKKPNHERTTDPQKCVTCNKIKDACEFTINKSKVNGINSSCKKCYTEKYYNMKHTCERTTEPQKCGKCNVIKLASEFNTHVSSINGLLNYCKKCETLIKNEYKYKSINNFLKLLYRSAKTSSKKRKLNFSISFDEWVNIYNNQQGKCTLSGLEMTISSENNIHNISPDRIDSNKGYTKENVHFVCWYINQAKSNLDTNTFIEMCRQVANFNTPT